MTVIMIVKTGSPAEAMKRIVVSYCEVVAWWCGGVVVWWRGGVVAWWCVWWRGVCVVAWGVWWRGVVRRSWCWKVFIPIPLSDVCLETEFSCPNKSCINATLVCNGHNNCDSGADEDHCLGAGESCTTGYSCENNRKCIPNR